MIARTGAEVWVEKGCRQGLVSIEACAQKVPKSSIRWKEIYANCDFVAKVKELEKNEI